MDVNEIRKLTKQGLTERKARELRQAREEIKAKRKADAERKRKEEEAFKRSIEYIENEIVKAAKDGTNAVDYDFGGIAYDEAKAICQYFENKGFKTKISDVKGWCWADYESGTSEEFWKTVITISW